MDNNKMRVRVIAVGDHEMLEGVPGTRLLRSTEDVVDVIGACFEHRVRSVLLYAENLTEGFFDLSSGEAGAILQKLRTYHIRLAVVAPQGGPRQSSRFREMASEESRGNDFGVFEDRDSAMEWLARD